MKLPAPLLLAAFTAAPGAAGTAIALLSVVKGGEPNRNTLPADPVKHFE